MRPLDPLAARAPLIARGLRRAPPAEVHAELTRVGALAPELSPLERASLRFAHGALALREGMLEAATRELDAASAELLAVGEVEAGLLAACEARIADLRRDPRAAKTQVIPALLALADDPIAAPHPRVLAVAAHYRGTAARVAGDARTAQEALLDALHRAEPFLAERAQILNSLGTLYVTLGAPGAARALLEHAAELHHQLGDVVGEAIAHGQLGSAAIALGDRAGARRHLQRQEWLASSIGDAFGRARALTALADLALDFGRPDEAQDLAMSAIAVANSVTPALTLWLAYAGRALGRARLELGGSALAEARTALLEARERFTALANPLGLALTAADLAELDAREGKPADLFPAAWGLGSLALPARVAKLLADQARAPAAPSAASRAAAAQSAPHLAEALEVSLVYEDAPALAALAARRTAAQRNLGRLAALSLAPPGLLLVAIVAPGLGGEGGLPGERAEAARLFELPGAVLWAFPPVTPPEQVARDLARLRAALGEEMRVLLAFAPSGRVISAPFQGEAGARVEGVDALGLLMKAAGLSPGVVARGEGFPWSEEAKGTLEQAGLSEE